MNTKRTSTHGGDVGQQQSPNSPTAQWPQTVRVKNEALDDNDDGTGAVFEFDIKPNIEELNASISDELPPPAKRYLSNQVIDEGTILGEGGNVVKPSPSVNSTSNSNIFNESFVKEELDMQESDSNEEGYSDVDLDDDEMIEDDDDNDCYDPNWSERPLNPRHIFTFETPLMNVGLDGRPKTTNSTFYFDKFLGDREDFFKLLSYGTNVLAQKLISDRDRSNAGQTYLKEISVEEMQIFMGLCLEMSNLKLLHLAEYWNDQRHCGFKGFGEKMSLNRFQLILRILNFEKLEPYRGDVLPTATQRSSVQSLINFFNMRMDIIYTCGPRLILNEPLVYWKGKLEWARDFSTRFRCNALNLHLLSEPSGLILKIVLDVDTDERRAHTINSRLLVQDRVNLALELLKEKLNQGHTVFASKYYGSFALGYELAKMNTYCTGYLDNRRYGNSKQLILNKLPEKCCVSTRYAASVMMGKWRRRHKNVYFFSSDCLAIHNREVKRGDDLRPKLIKELDWLLRPPNKMRDHIRNYQVSVDRQDISWSSNLAIFIFNLMVHNAYTFYTMHAQFGRGRVLETHLKDTTKLKSYTDFRQDVIHSLLTRKAEIKQQHNVQSTGNTSQSDADYEDEEARDSSRGGAHLLNIEHMPMVIPRRKGKVMKKKCRICRKGGLLTLSKLCCEHCPGMPGLCESPCFQIWHDQLKKSVESGKDIKTRIFGTSSEKTIYL